MTSTTTSTVTPPGRASNPAARYRPPPRRRSWPLVGGGLAAALVGSVVAGSMALSADQRQPVLVLAKSVEAGQEITAADLATVRVGADRGVPVVRTGQRSSVVGRVAAVSLPKGTLLQPAHVGSTTDLGPDEASVGVALEAGRFPPRLGAGDHVVAIASPAAPIGDGAEPEELGSGVVTSVEPLGSGVSTGSTMVIGLRLPRESAAPVASAGSARRLNLVLLPPS